MSLTRPCRSVEGYERVCSEYFLAETKRTTKCRIKKLTVTRFDDTNTVYRCSDLHQQYKNKTLRRLSARGSTQWRTRDNFSKCNEMFEFFTCACAATSVGFGIRQTVPICRNQSEFPKNTTRASTPLGLNILMFAQKNHKIRHVYITRRF